MACAKRLLTRIFSSVVAASLMLGSMALAAETNFTDVPSGSWYEEPISWAVEEGVTTGTSESTFSPDVTCSKAEILTFIWRACGSQEPAISNPFTDISSVDYYYNAALWAYENGIVDGIVFSPNTPCSRSMAVTYLWAKEGRPTPSTSASFTDVGSNADYVQAVSWAVEQEITNGTSATAFSPDEICSRSQIVTFLYRDVGNDELDGSSVIDLIF